MGRSARFAVRPLVVAGVAVLAGALLVPLSAQAASAAAPHAVAASGAAAAGAPPKPHVQKVGRSKKAFTGDLRHLSPNHPVKSIRPEDDQPAVDPRPYVPPSGTPVTGGTASGATASAPAPGTSANFDGLDFATWGAGHPLDDNGDVGPTYYIQTVNTSIGVFRKSDGVRVAAFTFNTLMSQGSFGNLCDTDNFGDPVVLYDSFEDRWIITDFAFKLDGAGNVVNPPGQFQCFAVSRSGDPVAGGWNFYSMQTVGGLGDYPKFGIWPDGLYMSANVFDYSASGGFQNARVWAFDKAKMYAGAPSADSVTFDAPPGEFTLLPANARLQTGTPPAGTPNYFSVVWQYTNAVSVYKFHVDWNSPATASFSGPSISLAPASWQSAPSTVTSGGGNALETLANRLMAQNQYSNIGGVESLWDSHTVQGSSSAQAAVRWYQVGVTAGAVGSTTTQAATYNPDSTVNRFTPSVAVDRVGDMAIGYTATGATLFPAVRYAGRLASDPANTITQTEASVIEGSGTQTGTCGSTCTRWGDYSAMTLDPDGCTFWYTNEYYATSGLNTQTRIGSFRLPGCATVSPSGGAVSGTVTSGGHPVAGATVTLGARATTTAADGTYAFSSLPAGTYPTMSATAAGLSTGTASAIAVTDGATTTRNFQLTAAVPSGCYTDTTQADFQTAASSTNCNFTSSPGDVTLASPLKLDQSNASVTTNGFAFNSTTWAGQTFTAATTGVLKRIDLDLFCSQCTGTTPDVTVSLRATSGDVPVGSDLATATVAGFASGAGGYYTATFATPAVVTAGTSYAVVFRATANPSAGVYAYVVSSGSPYAGGRRVTSTTSGSSWTGDSTRDLGFKTYVDSGFASSGSFVSSTKDANPAAGRTPTWTTLTWDATTPASTSVRFQVAASDNPFGPFSFVGPDGTGASYFQTSGASLSQFNGHRYLRYEAYLTGGGPVTPSVADVRVCFADVAGSSLAVDPASGTYAGTAPLSATLTASGSPLPDATVAFTLDGVPVGTAQTDASGVATVSAVSLLDSTSAPFPVGLHTGVVGASFAGDATDVAATGTADLTVGPASSTTTVSCPADVVYTGSALTPCTATVTGSGGLTQAADVSYQSNTDAGTAIATASFAGDANHTGSQDSTTFVVDQAASSVTVSCPATVTYTGSPLTPCTATAAGPPPLTGTASVSYSDNVAVGTATATGSYPGDANHTASQSDPVTFQISAAGATTTSVSVDPVAPNPAAQFSDTVTLRATVARTAGSTGAFHGTVAFTVAGVSAGSTAVSAAAGDASATGSVTVRLDSTVIPAGSGSYAVSAAFTPEAGSDVAGSVSAAGQTFSVNHEGEFVAGAGVLPNGSTALTYTGDQSVALGHAPTLSATLAQSLDPESADSDYVDFSTSSVAVVFNLYPARCGSTCPTTPTWTSGPVQVANGPSWASTGTGVASVSGPTSLAQGAYVLSVSLVSNGYIVAERTDAAVSVASSTGTFITGGGFLTTDSTSNTGDRTGSFAVSVKAGKKAIQGSLVYLYRMRIDTAHSNATALAPCTTLSTTCRDVMIRIRSKKVTLLTAASGSAFPLSGLVASAARVQVVDAVTGADYPALEFGSGTMRLDVVDGGSGGTADAYGLTAYRKNGTVFHQAFIPTTGALPQTGTGSPTNTTLIGGGTISVHHV